MPWTGPDWGLFRKLSIAAFVGVLCWSLLPWARCSFAVMDATRIVNVDDAHGHGMGDSADVLRAQRAEEFLGGFFGQFGVCYALNPIGEGQPWQWPAIGGTLAAAILFRRLDRWQYARRVRRMNVSQVDDLVSANRRAVQHTPSALDLDEPFELHDAPRAQTTDRPAALRRMSSNNVAAAIEQRVGPLQGQGERAQRQRPDPPGRDEPPKASESASAGRRTTGRAAQPDFSGEDTNAPTKRSNGPDWEWD